MHSITLFIVLFISEPNVTSFTATSYLHTVLKAELETNGRCPLVFSFNVFERPRGGKDLQHMGPPVSFAVTRETGAIINRLMNGTYKVELKYEAYNDPGCGERTIALVPMSGGAQIRIVPMIRRNVSVELRVSVRIVERTNGINVTLLDLDLCRLRNYSVTLENENEKVVKYLTEGSVIITTRDPCKRCKVTVDNIGYKSEMKPVVVDQISASSNLFEVSESDQNITINWDIPVQSFTSYQVIVSHPNNVVDVNSSRAIKLSSFQINSSTGSHSFEPRECGTYQVSLRHPDGMMENHSVTIQRRNDRVVVTPTYEADGNKLKLDLSKNDKCLGSHYYVNLMESNGSKLNKWVNKDDAELSGVACLPCNLTVSIPNATVAVSHSEPVHVWFGPSKFQTRFLSLLKYDRVVVTPTYEADGNKLKLDLSKNDKCLGSHYYVNLMESNGSKLNKWVNKDDAELSGVACLPCNLTVSIPNATVAVSHSEPVHVWFGPSKFQTRFLSLLKCEPIILRFPYSFDQ
ncbi:hypothetical protein FGIG_01835 [Fasciola gigantica]|uniref:Uncharacterized protein n=1 Tax=Fasciola gigantica TaxID=46835 RepID=A0A504ZAY9_FASGI|nr:hypothetical protein FGIG_01835 [Fasciola gigantica]